MPLSQAAVAETHTVSQVSLEFDPAEITIAVGDTVRWVWNSLSHTVTSGTDPDDPDVGTLFDAPLDSSNPEFVFVFDFEADIPYFCRPHYDLGMTGIVHVVDTTAIEGSTWGTIKQLYH